MKGFWGIWLLASTALNAGLAVIAETDSRLFASVFAAVVCGGAYVEWLLDKTKELDE